MNVKSMDTKDKLIEHAIELFVAKGFEATTFADIAKKCKISQPAIYNHFANKMDLLKNCALYSAKLGREYIDLHTKPHLSAKKRLHLYLESNLRWFAENPSYGSMIVSLYYFASSDKEMRVLYDTTLNAAIERIELILIQGQHESAWKLTASKTTASLIHSLLVGEVYKVLYAKSKSPKELNRAIIQIENTAMQLIN